jgi:hypothetical protein
MSDIADRKPVNLQLTVSEPTFTTNATPLATPTAVMHNHVIAGNLSDTTLHCSSWRPLLINKAVVQQLKYPLILHRLNVNGLSQKAACTS